MQPSKRRRIFETCDDTTMKKQVQATHSPDGRDIVVNPIIQLIEEILIHANDRNVDENREQAEALALAESDMLGTLAYIMHKISCELSCKGSGGGDAHGTTMALLYTLTSYPWHAKVVLTLAAFAVNFGGFLLVVQKSSTNTLAKSVAILKQLLDLEESSSSLKPEFDSLNLLVKAAIDVTKSIVEFEDLPSHYISEDTPPLSVANAHIPTAAYWTIRSIVALSSQIIGLIGLRNEYIPSTKEVWDLSSLAQKVSSIHEHLKMQLTICHKYIDDKKCVEDYGNLKNYSQIGCVDNQKILSILFGAATEPKPLVDANKERVSVEALRQKHVLLLISDLDISEDEILILDNLYKDAKQRLDVHYETVWIPVVNKLTWNDKNQNKFRHLQSKMGWYSVHHPLSINRSVIKYIKEDWNFSKRPIIVVLDPQAMMCSTNAIHMLWIWGNLAFPFTREREESLWMEETWSPELIVDGIDPLVLEWMQQGKHICFYGGKDIEWIQTFTKTAMSVATLANISLKLVYVGKSNAKELMQRMISNFAKKKFSYFWPVTYIWIFWARLQSMLVSKLQGNKTVENDEIMSEVMTILKFDGSDKGWAVFCTGDAKMARATGSTTLYALNEFENWKKNAERDGFVPALREYLEYVESPNHCNRIVIPGDIGGSPKRIMCPDCGRKMEGYLMYCCYGE